jgi:alpha-beta hydrolase superfamily lysophospholipase
MTLSNSVQGSMQVAPDIALFTETNLVPQAKGVVIIVHGLAEHLGRYDYVVSKLNEAGYSTYRYDHRGHGRSDGRRGYLDDFNIFINDTDRMVEKARIENPGLPLFMLGHSMGGYITAAYGVKYPDKLQGQILSGAAVIVLPIFEELKDVDFNSEETIMVPNALGHLICRDQAVVKDYADDPLVLKEMTRKLLGQVFITGAQWLMKNMGRHEIPCLILHGGDDRIVTPEASKFMYANASAKDKTLKIYEGMFHEILNESDKDMVIEDIRQWLDSHLQHRSPQSSSADRSKKGAHP